MTNLRKYSCFRLSFILSVLIFSKLTTGQQECEAPEYTCALLGIQDSVGRLIWSDRGSGSDADFSCFESSQANGVDFFTAGQHAQPNHNTATDTPIYAYEPFVDAEALAVPMLFQKLWDDNGSGADADASVWRPECPPGYVSVGDVMHGSKASEAPAELYQTVRCVKYIYTMLCQWGSPIWNDSGSGADLNVEMWTIQCDGGAVDSMMYASRQHGTEPQTIPYAVDRRYLYSLN